MCVGGRVEGRQAAGPAKELGLSMFSSGKEVLGDSGRAEVHTGEKEVGHCGLDPLP